MPSPIPPSPEPDDSITAAAAAWLARRDRGLTAPEQDELLEWCREDSRHRAALACLERTWSALDGLAQWRPADSAHPNPDLLGAGMLPPLAARRRSLAAGVVATLAVAALVLGGFYFVRPAPAAREPALHARALRVIPAPERRSLEDGSVVAFNHGGKIETLFTAGERRVRLLQGEAHFTVAKNPARPFVVEVDGVAVRAVGTAFNVRCSTGAVEVLVTEGRVQVEPAAALHVRADASLPTATAGAATALSAGERAVVDTTTPDARPVVAAVSGAELDHALAWQGTRLEFSELALADVVTEFNLRNRQQLVIADERVGRVRVGGSFRADNVEGFVRLLATSFEVAHERSADGTILLRRAR